MGRARPIEVPVKHNVPLNRFKTDALSHLGKTSTTNMYRSIMLAILVGIGLSLACGRRGLPQDDYSIYEQKAWALMCETNMEELMPTLILSNLNRAIQLKPDDVRVESYILRAHCWDMIGEREKAIRDWKMSIDREPNNPTNVNTYCILASIDGEKKDLPIALDYINRSIALDPEYSVAHCTRAAIYRDMGLIEDAKNELNLALELDPQITNSIDIPEFFNSTNDWVKESGP